MTLVSIVGGPGVLLGALHGLQPSAKGVATVELSISNAILTIKFTNPSKSVFYKTSLTLDLNDPSGGGLACQVFLKDFVNALQCCSGFQQLDIEFDPLNSSLVRLCCSDTESGFSCEIRTVDLILSYDFPPSILLASFKLDCEVAGTAFAQCHDSGIDKVFLSLSGQVELRCSSPGGCDTHVVIPERLLQNISCESGLTEMTLPGKEIGVITSFLSCSGKCDVELSSSGILFRKVLVTGNEADLVVCACENY